ncbi:reverse transcriptase domain-containing protein [Metallibacterium sp.]
MTQKWTHCYQLKPGRWVFAPTDEARVTGQRIKSAVEARWKPPCFYFHLRGGGHVAAVHSHMPSKFFFRADIDDFFGRVSKSRITRCLKSWFSYANAREMASESVVKRPGVEGFVLPYGFVQSPVLASLALEKSKLGAYLRKLSGRGDLRVSVYVDDIIISGDDEGLLGAVGQQVVDVASKAFFPLGVGKREGPAEEVTAFNIRVSHAALDITDKRMAALRLSYQTAMSEFAKAGILSYVNSVNPLQSKTLR